MTAATNHRAKKHPRLLCVGAAVVAVMAAGGGG
jgi:hypothetical protein